MLSEAISIKHKLQVSVHFDSVLRKNKLSVVFNGQLFKSEKTQVTEDHVEDHVVSIWTYRVSFDKDFDEDFEEVLVPNTPIENLFNKHLLIWVLKSSQEIVGMWINRADYGVECFDAFGALLDEFWKFHIGCILR